jgi:hypothetical protein
MVIYQTDRNKKSVRKNFHHAKVQRKRFPHFPNFAPLRESLGLGCGDSAISSSVVIKDQQRQAPTLVFQPQDVVRGDGAVKTLEC